MELGANDIRDMQVMDEYGMDIHEYNQYVEDIIRKGTCPTDDKTACSECKMHIDGTCTHPCDRISQGECTHCNKCSVNICAVCNEPISIDEQAKTPRGEYVHSTCYACQAGYESHQM